MKTLIAILILLTCRAAGAVQPGWADNRVVYMADGGTGSFVEIGGKVFLISCAHRTVDSSVPVGFRVQYLCSDGSGGMATAIAVNPMDFNSAPFHDCAIYSFAGSVPARVTPFRFSNRALKPGEQVWIVGFPCDQQGGCNYSCRITTVIEDGHKLLLRGDSKPGESGGPIVNSDGDLVGTLTGAIDNNVTYCCGRAVESDLCKKVGVSYCGSCEGGCCQQGGSCQSGGCCPQYSQPIYRSQPVRQPLPCPPPAQAPPLQPVQPLTPSMPAQVKPIPGPTGPPGPQGPPGDPASCGCGPKWEAINAQLTNIQNEMHASQAAVSQLTTIVGELSQRPAAPTMDEIEAEMKKRLTHSMTVQTLDGTVKTQTKPLSEPLDLIQHSVGAKKN